MTHKLDLYRTTASWSDILGRMNCNSGIKDDDSDVDIETITDDARSTEMPGHSVQNLSSTSALISTKPILGYKNTDFEDGIQIPATRSYRIKKMPSRKSGKISISQASSLKSQNENSAARCFVILGREPKLRNENKLTTTQSPPIYTQVRGRVRCHISAATSSTTTVRSTQLARRTYIRNPAVRAIDKQGSHQHYLHTKFKRLISIMSTYTQNLDRELRLSHFAIDSFTYDFDHDITIMKSKVGSNDYENLLEQLASKIRLCDHNLLRKSQLVNSVLNSYAVDLEKKITSLNSKITPYAHDLGMQITLMNSTINSFDVDLKRKLKIWNVEAQQFSTNVRREYVWLMSKIVV